MPRTVIVTQPVVEPITLAEAMTHCRVDSPAPDAAYITSLITVAREHIESITNRALVDRTVDWYFDSFPQCGNYDSANWPLSQKPLSVPHAPLVSVTHIKYVDDSGTLQTWASSEYVVDTVSFEGRVYPDYGKYYPTDVRYQPDAVVMRYVAGYTITTDSPQDSPLDYTANIPTPIKQAMKLIVGHLYENREYSTEASLGAIPLGVTQLLAPYRVRRF